MVSDDTSKTLHSVNDSFSWPSIIRLKRYVRAPYRRVVLTRKNILRRDGFKCAYCGRGDLPLTVDHIIPRSKGGMDRWENLIAACNPCNNKKGNRTPEEANMHLLVKPYVPSQVMFIKNSVNRVNDTWKPYLFIS